MTERATPVPEAEQFRLIQECRTSGLSDHQWCMEHGIRTGTFYNWVKRLRSKACYDIPPACGRNSDPDTKHQEVVPLLIVDDDKAPASLSTSADHVSPVIEIICQDMKVRISNGTDPALVRCILASLGGAYAG